MDNYKLWGANNNTETDKLKLYKFNTTINYYNTGKILVIEDICKHYSLEEAKASIIKYNEDRGFKVLKIELAS